MLCAISNILSILITSLGYLKAELGFELYIKVEGHPLIYPKTLALLNFKVPSTSYGLKTKTMFLSSPTHSRINEAFS